MQTAADVCCFGGRLACLKGGKKKTKVLSALVDRGWGEAGGVVPYMAKASLPFATSENRKFKEDSI